MFIIFYINIIKNVSKKYFRKRHKITMASNIYSDENNILFGRSRGCFRHPAQKVYINIINDVVQEYLDEDEYHLRKRFDYDESLVMTVRDRIHSANPNITFKNQIIVDMYEDVTDVEIISKKIWESLKRRKQYVCNQMHDKELYKEFLASKQNSPLKTN